MAFDPDVLAALCIADEAAGEPFEGKVAVGRVIRNRMAGLYESDGTVEGTVLKKFQFSGFWFAMQGGKYKEIEFDQAGAEAQAQRLLVQFQQLTQTWADCVAAWAASADGAAFAGGPEYAKLLAQPKTYMYVNRDVCDPAWATAADQVCKIFHHTFYLAPPPA